MWLAARELTFPSRLERWLTVGRGAALLDAARALGHGGGALRHRPAPAALERARHAAQELDGGDPVRRGAAHLGRRGAARARQPRRRDQPLLAGLGIGGIALALAVQTVLGDLLASLSIALDKPFGLGDFLTVDDCQGSVEHIGVKSTRLRSVNGEQIIISNGDLLKARVRNYGRLTERRALFVLPVHYETPVATLAAVPRAVREIIEATPDVRFDRCHLLRCAETALEFEAVFFVTRPEYRAYADAQQTINLRILERFRAMEVSFIATVPQPVRLHPPLTPAADAGGQQRLL